jgi:hypothetical protein
MKNKSWFVVCLLIVAIASPTAALAEDQYRFPSGETITGTIDSDFSAGWRKIGIYEYSRATASTSGVWAFRQVGNQPSWELCDSHNSGFCAEGSPYQVMGASILPPCETDDQTNCIDSVEVGTRGQLFDAALHRQIPGFTFEGDPAKGVPPGSTVSVWKSSEFPHTGGDEYSVFSSVDWSLANGQLTITDFHLNIAATVEKFNSRVGTSMPMARGAERGANGGSAECFYTSTQTCAYHQVFSPNTRMKASVRLSNQLSGWLFGRLKAPVVSVSKINSESDLVVIEADPVTVPKLQTTWNQNDIPGLVDPVWTGNFGGGSFMTLASVPDAFRFISELRNVAKDTASGQRQYWGIQSSKWTSQAGQRCFSRNQGLVGLVTTNAMGYQGGVPTFNNGFLNYGVAGMHYLPDGEKALGTYDLTMRSDVARCIYGFSRAPISATVSVTGSGDSGVATTVVGEKNGWLRLAAYGFTFSQKTIKVKLAQKRTTITCVSKPPTLNVRKVTAIGPKCPSGYRQR